MEQKKVEKYKGPEGFCCLAISGAWTGMVQMLKDI